MIETDLQKLSPKKISDSLLDRLDAAMCSWDHSVLIADADPEVELLELVPLVAPYDMIERLDTAMSRWHESVPVEEKVISPRVVCAYLPLPGGRVQSSLISL